MHGPQIVNNTIVTSYDLIHNHIKKTLKASSDSEDDKQGDPKKKKKKIQKFEKPFGENFTQDNDLGKKFNPKNLQNKTRSNERQGKPAKIPEINLSGQTSNSNFSSQWALDQNVSSTTDTKTDWHENFSFVHKPGEYSNYKTDSNITSKSSDDVTQKGDLPDAFFDEFCNMVNCTDFNDSIMEAA